MADDFRMMPAFPKLPHPNGLGYGGATGMSIRDYFAAHAPAVPEWYRPEPQYPDPAKFGAVPLDDDRWNWQDEKGLKAYGEICQRLDASQVVNRAATWPWFYADMVLAQRDTGGTK